MTFSYTELELDRCSNQRKNKAWLQTEFTQETSVFYPIHDGQCLFSLAEMTPLCLTKAQLPSLQLSQCVFLGKKQKSAVFAIDQSKLRFSCQEFLASQGQWQPLRQSTSLLNAQEAALLALAKGLVHWHNTHQYCGLCGSTSRSVEAGHARKCNECRNLTFPRTDPAVIMLVERMFDDGIARCLLGRQANWPAGVYSTLAGFVDPGETLEAAVIREVAEETNIIAQNPQYIASQPWPFPASIMLGFVAQATSEDIDTRQDSLEIAQWFSREQLQAFAVNHSVITTQNTTQPLKHAEQGETQAWADEPPPYKMSSSDSISSYLIQSWLNKEIGQY